MNNITELIESLLKSFRSIDHAQREFWRMIDDDQDLKTQYAEWCDEYGYSERYGFQDYAEEYLDNLNSIWDSLADYDE